MKLEWGTTDDVTAKVHGKGPFANAAIDDYGIVIEGSLEEVIVIEGSPEDLLAWAEALVAKVAKATGMEPHAPVGSTVYVLRNHDHIFAYGSAEARTAHEAAIARVRWEEIVDDDLPAGQFDVDEVPDDPPTDDKVTADMFREAIEMSGDSYHPETDTLTVIG